MLSTQDRTRLNNEAARRAARTNLHPYNPTPSEITEFPPFPFPYLGDYVPGKWKRLSSTEINALVSYDNYTRSLYDKGYFVDISGLGADDEPAFALSIRQFKEVLEELLAADSTLGFALTNIGRFRAHVGVYRYVGEKAKKVVSQ